jgi:hypothetical protein
MTRRPQFSLNTMLWVMALVGAFFVGATWQRQRMISAGWFYIVVPPGGDFTEPP